MSGRKYSVTVSQSDYRDKLRAQLISAHAKVQYTFTSHEKDIHRLKAWDFCLRWFQIILSAITASSLVELQQRKPVFSLVFSFYLLPFFLALYPS